MCELSSLNWAGCKDLKVFDFPCNVSLLPLLLRSWFLVTSGHPVRGRRGWVMSQRRGGGDNVTLQLKWMWQVGNRYTETTYGCQKINQFWQVSLKCCISFSGTRYRIGTLCMKDNSFTCHSFMRAVNYLLQLINHRSRSGIRSIKCIT